MCGPSSSQKELAAGELNFSQLLQGNYAQNFGAQSAELSKLNNTFTPIVEAGPDQQGWGPQEAAAVNTQIGEGVGNNYAKATQSLNANLSAQGGGNEFLPSGASAQLKSQLATAGANQMSQEQLGATEANYAQGRTNYNQATAGLQALQGDYNPNALAGETTSATQGAYQDATQNAMQATQQFSAIAGGVSGLMKSAATDATAGYNIAAGGGQIPQAV